jgi:hypothetical protein
MAGKGFAGVREAAADINARKSGGGWDGRLMFKLDDGESGTVRFLEQGDEVMWAWMHQLPARGKQKFGDDIPCRDQERTGEPCPSCQAGGDEGARSFVGFINLIWRNAPVYKVKEDGYPERDAKGNFVIVGTKDQVAYWSKGITVFEELDGKDQTYKGLTTRDFIITRRGTGMNTRYAIEPLVVDGETKAIPLSDNDQELMKMKNDFAPDVSPLSYEEHSKLLTGAAPTQSNDGAQAPSDTSPFMKR